MIQANELRIGNWVKRKSGGCQQVLEVLSTMVLLQNEPPLDVNKTMRLPLSSVEPIPLTPEILKKAGLKRDKEGWVLSFDFKIYDPLEIGGAGDYVQSNRNIFTIIHNNSVFPKGFKYLHQLQNLYFALTSEELEINLQ